MNEVKVIKFSAPWCSYCKPLKPIFDTIKEQYKDNQNFEYQEVDIEDDVDTTEKYSIRSLPTIIFLKNDVEVFRCGSQTESTIGTKILELLS